MTSLQERLESLGRVPRDRARLLAIYHRMPEVGGALIPGREWPTIVTWYGGQIGECLSVWHYRNPSRVEPLSPGWVICNASLRRRPMLIEWARGADARIRAEASAAGLALPLSGYCLDYISSRRGERVWIVEGVAIVPVENPPPGGHNLDAISFPYLFALLPGVYATLFAPVGDLARRIADDTGVPVRAVRDYLRGRLSRTAWGAEVAMARLGGER